MPQPRTPDGKGEHDEDPLRADLNAADFEFDEEGELDEDDLVVDSDDEADDWFDDDDGLEGDDLGAGDDDFDSDENPEDFFGTDEAEEDEEEAAALPSAVAPLLERVRAAITEQQLFDLATTHRVLVAVSGGKDSVVLLDALHRLGVPVAVAHAHFGLRPDDADLDAEFVRKLAKKYDAPFHLEHFATQQFAQQEGISTQMAARALRYAWFARLCQTHHYVATATAHHRADLAETMLLNLVRGTGLAGLHGIRAKVGGVVRPLLGFSLDDIHDWLAECQLTWREDASNQSRAYRRNRLRHDVLPVLRELNPNFDQTLASTAERIQQAEDLVAGQVAQVAAEALEVQPDVTYLNVVALQRTPATTLLLSELLRPYGFDYAAARTVAAALGSVAGTRFHSPTHQLVIDRGRLVITPRDLRAFGSFELTEAATTLPLTGGKRLLQQRVAVTPTYKLPRGTNVAALDAARLRYPLTVRPWQPGDWLIPLGMRGKQKVSDLLVNQKVPANLKDRVLVVVNANGSIVWVIGHRVDDRFKLTPDTAEVMEISLR